jgi:F0F1-type ATP synthase assembly protein I
MSQETPTVTDVSRSEEHDSSLERRDETEAETGMDVAHESEAVDAGPGASEGGFAVRFGSGFAIGMFVGAVVGILLNSLALAMFGGFILGTVVGIVLAARA